MHAPRSTFPFRIQRKIRNKKIQDYSEWSRMNRPYPQNWNPGQPTAVPYLDPSTFATASRAPNTPPRPSPAKRPAYQRRNIRYRYERPTKAGTYSHREHIHIKSGDVISLPQCIEYRSESPGSQLSNISPPRI
jgi:hypothetical protein